MSKQYQVKLDLDTSKLTPTGGFLRVPCEKDVDERGFRERSGPEVFVLAAQAAINGANPRCGYDALKDFRKLVKDLRDSVDSGVFVTNKTNIEIIKNSIRGNQNWSNNDEVAGILDQVMGQLETAVEIT